MIINRFIPFSVYNIIFRALNRQVETILDVGCGNGVLMKKITSILSINPIGIDMFEPYLANCKRIGSHSEVVKGDVRNLPFERKSFDAVLCVEVLEHLEKDEGRQLLIAMEGLARKKIILTTPFGRHEQHAFDWNPQQEHKAAWTYSELRQMGYKVRGQGLCLSRFVNQENTLEFVLPVLLKPLGKAIWTLATPFTYFYPKLAGRGICVKELRGGSLTLRMKP